MFDTSHGKDCRTKQEANQTHSKLIDMEVEFFALIDNCNLPCNQSYFSHKEFLYHTNAVPMMFQDLSRDPMYLVFLYETLMVEEHIENLMYDIGSVLTAAGGNLGLTLGFSCLTSVYFFIQCLKNALITTN